ncbi:PH domain-containing protein [Candidatus Kaiserbacteria bacterium]|nr:PH domain-containing protein [Candidatus Kaiserbacteria bacterium]
MLLEKIQLEKDEIVINTVRKHWFILFAELIGIFFLAILPIILYIGFILLPENISHSEVMAGQGALLIFTICGWLVVCIMGTAMIWTHYYLDLWIITDRRIIVVDQIRFFSRKVSSFRLERMQDIKVSVNGIIPTLLNYGTMRAQTAGAADNNFESKGLPDPRALQATIQKATDARLKVVFQHPNQQLD